MQMKKFFPLIKVYESKITKSDHRLPLYISEEKKGILLHSRIFMSQSVGFKLENEQPTLQLHQLS